MAGWIQQMKQRKHSFGSMFSVLKSVFCNCAHHGKYKSGHGKGAHEHAPLHHLYRTKKQTSVFFVLAFVFYTADAV